jgi:hypothetical protein
MPQRLEDWAQRMVVKDAFAEAAGSLHELLGIDVSVRSLEGMNRRMASDVEAFREQQPAPVANDEGELLVVHLGCDRRADASSWWPAF